ncbi:phosphotransferase family protein [Marivita sp.]|uniref:phosphotransferase family protein n=1 Tax=Marivita sp. TaxID=2003365 RepID=UPI003A881865
MTTTTDTMPSFLDAWQNPRTFDAVCHVLQRRPRRLVLERTHFPGNRPVQLVLRADMADGSFKTLFAEHCPHDTRAHADQARASLFKSRNGQRSGLDDRAIHVVDGSGLILRRPGLDERLPGLRLLHDPSFARERFQNLIGRDPGRFDVELVAHRLGKRAVLRATLPDRTFYVRLRVIKSNDGQDRLLRHRTLWNNLGDQPDLRIPEPLGSMPEIGASFFGVLPGVMPEFHSAHSAATARAISNLQGLALDGLPVHTGGDEAAILLEWLARCYRWKPQLADHLAEPVAEVSAALARNDTPRRPCHRDLHEKQILISGGVAGLLDFDTLCLSDPALDAGNLLAHFFLSGINEGPLRSQLKARGIALWRRATLLRLAMIYAFSAAPDAAVDRLIKEARRDARD